MLEIEYKKITVIDHYVTGQRARNMRINLGIKQKYFAEIMGYSAQHLALMEQGKRPWHEYKIKSWNKAYEQFQADLRIKRLQDKREMDRIFFGDDFVNREGYNYAVGEAERRKSEVEEILNRLPTEKKIK